MLHLFREAWLQKFVDFGSDVGLMKFGDVIRLIDRDRDELTDGELLRTMEAHSVTDAVAWVLRRLDETFHTHTLELLALEKHGDEKLLAIPDAIQRLCARFGPIDARAPAKQEPRFFAAGGAGTIGFLG